ncbi:hypothetical protein AK812_SmicGene727 [Symbiodinium microadriaticum]|uniref:Uncharacterized protein n=1 Tax=Symbiodinium microadriaticum TaxID=2951 RepID=A0A1Q9F646_SYMMI|nr:hypothetical protein AK812_SmicGene727 [Symbiodinium microadriaticum]
MVLALQQRLTRLADRCVAAGLMNKLRAQERWGDLRRLQDDGPSGITKAFAGLTKAFALTQPTNSPLPFGFASAAVALQNPFSAAAIASPRCNAAASMLNTVLPERAPLKGVTMTFHAIAKTTDFQAELEPEGLIASHPRLRPANVLTGIEYQPFAVLSVFKFKGPSTGNWRGKAMDTRANGLVSNEVAM